MAVQRCEPLQYGHSLMRHFYSIKLRHGAVVQRCVITSFFYLIELALTNITNRNPTAVVELVVSARNPKSLTEEQPPVLSTCQTAYTATH